RCCRTCRLFPTRRSSDLIRHYPLNAVWRVRRGPLSATVFGGATRLMTLVYGAAELNSIKISQTYFGVGWFVSDSLRASGETAVLDRKSTRLNSSHVKISY